MREGKLSVGRDVDIMDLNPPDSSGVIHSVISIGPNDESNSLRLGQEAAVLAIVGVTHHGGRCREVNDGSFDNVSASELSSSALGAWKTSACNESFASLGVFIGSEERRAPSRGNFSVCDMLNEVIDE